MACFGPRCYNAGMTRRTRPSANALREQKQDATPAPDLSRFATMDDISVILLLGKDPDARLELDNRLRKEIQVCGGWTSGPDLPVPPPFAREHRRFL